jgi:transcriptional regulator with XRE-family HTH domain
MAVDPDAQELARKVGAEIARWRKASGHTQVRVADALGMEKETVSRIETGVIAPTLHRLAQFSDFFGCPITALFGDYRGKAAEDAAELAEILAGLSDEERRSILRGAAETARILRDRAAMIERLQQLVEEMRLAAITRDELQSIVANTPSSPRRKPRRP